MLEALRYKGQHTAGAAKIAETTADVEPQELRSAQDWQAPRGRDQAGHDDDSKEAGRVWKQHWNMCGSNQESVWNLQINVKESCIINKVQQILTHLVVFPSTKFTRSSWQ